MNYTLNFDGNNNLSGWQSIKYELNGQEVEEMQFFVSGKFHSGFINVSGVGSNLYAFYFESWGNWEIMRDMAEGFAADCEFNFIMRSTPSSKIIRMLPSNEGAFV